MIHTHTHLEPADTALFSGETAGHDVLEIVRRLECLVRVRVQSTKNRLGSSKNPVFFIDYSAMRE